MSAIVSPEGESFSEWLRAVAGTNEMGSVYPRRLGSLPLVPLAAGAQSLGRPGLARTGSVRGGLVTRALPGEGLLFLARSKSRQESSRKARPRPGAGFPEGREAGRRVPVSSPSGTPCDVCRAWERLRLGRLERAPFPRMKPEAHPQTQGLPQA